MVMRDEIELYKDDSIHIGGMLGSRLVAARPEDAREITDILYRAFLADCGNSKDGRLIGLLKRCADASLVSAVFKEGEGLVFPADVADCDVIVAEAEGEDTDKTDLMNKFKPALKEGSELFIHAAPESDKNVGAVQLVGLNFDNDDGVSDRVFKKITFFSLYTHYREGSKEGNTYFVYDELTLSREDGRLVGTLSDGTQLNTHTPLTMHDARTIALDVQHEHEMALVDLRRLDDIEDIRTESFLDGAMCMSKGCYYKVTDSALLISPYQILLDEAPLNDVSYCEVTKKELNEIIENEDNEEEFFCGFLFSERSTFLLETILYSMIAAVLYRLFVFDNLLLDDGFNTLGRTPSLLIFWCLAVILPTALCALLYRRREGKLSSLMCAVSGIGVYAAIAIWSVIKSTGILELGAPAAAALIAAGILFIMYKRGKGEHYEEWAAGIVMLTVIVCACLFIYLASVPARL